MATFRATDGNYIETFQADSMAVALAHAADSWRNGDWDAPGTVDVTVSHVDDDGNDTGDPQTVPVLVGSDPPEPACTCDRGHDWRRPVEVERPGLSFEGVLYHVEREGARRWVAWVDDDTIEHHRLDPSLFRGVEFCGETKRTAVDDVCDTIRAAIQQRDALFAGAIASTSIDQGAST
jgi:hypothetical protein